MTDAVDRQPGGVVPVGDAVRRLKFLRRHGPRFWRGAQARAVRRAADIAAGFDPNEADWYRQIHGDTRGLVANYHRETHLHGLNGHYAYVLDNKALLTELLGARGIATPRLLARYHGRWHWEADGREALEAELARTGRAVVKPALGSKGRSVLIARSAADVEGWRGEDAILTPFVQQAAYADRIFPGSLNTIRVLMMRDGAGAPVVVAATHRFGSAQSGPVDNFSAGGVVAKVDRATGVLARAVRIGVGNRVAFRDDHPDTGEAIAGVAVPRWDGVREFVLRLGEAFPYLVYVGWDVAVTEAGPVLIEGNAHPNLRFFQFYDRLLEDPELRPLFQRIIAGRFARR